MLMLCYHCKMTSLAEAGVFHQLILEASTEEHFFSLWATSWIYNLSFSVIKEEDNNL